jgi:hypothetical protein
MQAKKFFIGLSSLEKLATLVLPFGQHCLVQNAADYALDFAARRRRKPVGGSREHRRAQP